MRRREHQSGFGTTVVLLAVLVVAVLAVTGVVVYQHHKPSSAKKSAATNQTQTTTSQPQSTTTSQTQQGTVHNLDINEWGVHMTLDSTTASLYYYISPDQPNIAYLSLKTISAIAPQCAADKGSLAAIGRLTEAEHQAIVSGSTPGNPGTVHIGSYWYSYEGTHADCTDGTPAMQAAVKQAAPNFNASTLQTTFTTLAADPSTN